MSELRTLDCGELAGLLPFSAYDQPRNAREVTSFIWHRPERQLFEDSDHCSCTPGNSEWWQENQDRPEKCRHLTVLEHSAYPGLRLVLCCECWDRWRPNLDEALRVRLLFDAVAEAEGIEVAA